MRINTLLLITIFIGTVSVFAWQQDQNSFGPSLQMASGEQKAGGALSITEPKDRASVPERPYIEGKVSNPNADVWIIVHPMEVTDYWVQPRLTVRADGAWRASAYVGRPGRVDVGKHFEIMAVANPKRPLKEGDVLQFWPDAELKSGVIEVVRK